LSTSGTRVAIKNGYLFNLQGEVLDRRWFV
jgi:hypothetical protein